VATVHAVPGTGISWGKAVGGTYTNAVAEGVVMTEVVGVDVVDVEGEIDVDIGLVVMVVEVTGLEEVGDEVEIEVFTTGIVVVGSNSVTGTVVSDEDLHAEAGKMEARAAPATVTPARFKNCRLENFATRNSCLFPRFSSFIIFNSPHIVQVFYN
jgi:hypothetical protein